MAKSMIEKSGYYIISQAAKKLKMSVSCFKMVIRDNPGIINEKFNSLGWRLFNEHDLEKIRDFNEGRTGTQDHF